MRRLDTICRFARRKNRIIAAIEGKIHVKQGECPFCEIAYSIPICVYFVSSICNKSKFLSFCFTAKCLYKGVQYSQGMRWDDGCQYTCICTEAMKGKYVCDEKYVIC